MQFNNLVNRVYQEDLDTQLGLLEHIREIRKFPTSEVFVRNKMFFATSDDYVAQMGGDYLRDELLGLYRKDSCLGVFKLWIPIYDFKDDVVGFNWYSDGSIEREEGRQVVKYKFQVGTFVKRRYLNIRREDMLKAMQEGYVCIVDGFMDKYHLEHYKHLSASTYGSNLDIYKQSFLATVKHHIVFMDNDPAGVKLATQAQMNAHKHGCICTIVKQGVGKDIDDFLKAHPDNHFVLDEAIARIRREPPPCGEITLSI